MREENYATCSYLVIIHRLLSACFRLRNHRIRLYCIDAPEKGKPHSQIAKQTLADMIFKKKVKASCIGKDRYKRDICTIRYRGRNINLQMVKRGLAKVFKKYCDDKMYYRAE